MGRGQGKGKSTDRPGKRLPEPEDELISESAFAEIYEEARVDLPPAGRIAHRHPDEVPTAVIRELAPMDGADPPPAPAPAAPAAKPTGPWDGTDRRRSVDRRSQDRRRRLGGWPPLPRESTSPDEAGTDADASAAEDAAPVAELDLEQTVATWAQHADRPAPPVSELARMRRRIDAAADIQALGAILVEESLARAVRVVLLRRRKDAWLGWTGAGPGIDVERVAELVVPPTEGSAFGLVAQGSGHFQGPLADHPTHRRFLHSLGIEAPETAALIPIQHGDRAAMGIYLDGGASKPVAADLGELIVLAQQVPAVLKRFARGNAS